MRRTFMLLAQHLTDLGQLFHKVDLGLQAAGGIHKEDVHLFGQGAIHGFVGHGGRIGTGGAGMEERAHALGPDLQLLDGRRTEGVGRGDHDLFALHAGTMGQLGDGGGLAHAVDADEEHHFGRVHGADATRQTEDLVHFGHEQAAYVFHAGHVLLAGPFTQTLHQLQRRFVAQVSHDEELFQFFPETFVEFAVAAEQAVQTAGELLAGTAQAFADLEEQAAALVFLVLHVQGQGQAILQLGAEFVQLHIFHTLQPATEIIHEGVHFGGGRIQRTQQEAQTLPEFVPGFFHTFQHDAQPDGEARFGLAQTQDHGLGQSGIETAGLQRGRGGTLGRGSRRGNGSGGKGRIGHDLSDGLVLVRRSSALRVFFHLGRRFLFRAFSGSRDTFIRICFRYGSFRMGVFARLLLHRNRRFLSLASRGSGFRPGRIFITAEDALPPAATGRSRFGLFFRFFADLVAGSILFHNIRSGFGSFFSGSFVGFNRGHSGRIVPGRISHLGGIGPGHGLRQRFFFLFPGSLHNGLSLGSHSFRFGRGLFLFGRGFFHSIHGSRISAGRLFAHLDNFGFRSLSFRSNRFRTDAILFGGTRFCSGITGSFFRRRSLGSRFRHGLHDRRNFIFHHSSRGFFRFGDRFAFGLHGGLIQKRRHLSFRHRLPFRHGAFGFCRSFGRRRLVSRRHRHGSLDAPALLCGSGGRAIAFSGGHFHHGLIRDHGFSFRRHLFDIPGNGGGLVFRGLVRRCVFSRGNDFFSRRDALRFRRAFRLRYGAPGISGRLLRGNRRCDRFLLDCRGLRFFRFLGAPTKKLFYCGKKAHSLSLFHCGPAQGLQNFFKISRTGLHGQRTRLTAGILQRIEHLAGAVLKAHSPQAGRCGKQHPPQMAQPFQLIFRIQAHHEHGRMGKGLAEQGRGHMPACGVPLLEMPAADGIHRQSVLGGGDILTGDGPPLPVVGFFRLRIALLAQKLQPQRMQAPQIAPVPVQRRQKDAEQQRIDDEAPGLALHDLVRTFLHQAAGKIDLHRAHGLPFPAQRAHALHGVLRDLAVPGHGLPVRIAALAGKKTVPHLHRHGVQALILHEPRHQGVRGNGGEFPVQSQQMGETAGHPACLVLQTILCGIAFSHDVPRCLRQKEQYGQKPAGQGHPAAVSGQENKN